MMAFDHVFWDVAKRDSRAIQTVDGTGSPATFVFREFYCTDPGCDCRRVVLHIHWVEAKRVAASINYAFEPSRRRSEPQISLDPLNPQSEHSSALLTLFIEMLAKDREFRERLHRHYAMWKQVVDDPSHPDHKKVRGAAHDDPSFRPAFPKRGREPRRPRNAAQRARARSQGLELVVAKAARADGKLQQRFKRLLEKVDRLRQRLRAWKDQRPNIDRELAAYAALFEQQSRLAREMVTLLDRSYANAGFSKADRKTLAAVISSLAGELLEQGGLSLTREQLVQLRERLGHSVVGALGRFEGFGRGVDLVQDDPCRLAAVLERQRADLAGITALVVRPHQARVRGHLEISAEERHRPVGCTGVFEHEAVGAAGPRVDLAREQGEAGRLRHPPALHPVGRGPRLEHETRGRIEGARDDNFALGRLFHRRVVAHRADLAFSFDFISSSTWSSSSKRARHSWR